MSYWRKRNNAKCYSEETARFYHPVKRSFIDVKTGKPTSLIIEKIYWDLLDAMASRTSLPWPEVVAFLAGTVGRDRRNITSHLRAALARDLLVRLEHTQGA